MQNVENGPEREMATSQLLQDALVELERKYGSAKTVGEQPLAYHNVEHTTGVMNAAEQIAQLAETKGALKESDKALIKIAACFHDIEQALGSGANEEASAQLAAEKMKMTGIFSDEDIEKVKIMILATKVHFENGEMKQSATKDYLTQLISDADLSSLGQPPEIYWANAEALLKEIKKTDNFSKEDLIDFCRAQIKLLSNHRFYTEEAQGLFKFSQYNLKFVQKKLGGLEAT